MYSAVAVVNFIVLREESSLAKRYGIRIGPRLEQVNSLYSTVVLVVPHRLTETSGIHTRGIEGLYFLIQECTATDVELTY